MTTLTVKHVTETAPHTFACDASDLYDLDENFRYGWPSHIETTIGNGQPLIRTDIKRNNDGDVEFVRYEQVCGIVQVRIYND